MRKSTKTVLIVGAAVVGAVAVGGIAYAASHKTPAAPSGALPAFTPVTTFTPGTRYTIASTVPAAITDTTALTSALAAVGWTNPNVVYFMGTGTIPTGFESSASGYVATGTWGGAANTPVPAGVIAAATPA